MNGLSLETELLKFKYLYKIQTMYQSKVKKEYEHLILQNDYMFDTVISYIVSGDLSSHRSITKNGVHLLIIDGNFLNPNI